MSGFTKIIQKDLDKLESSIDDLLSTRVGYIKEIVTYIIKSGGKRVRPVLVMLCSKLCGYRGKKHIPYAAIIEFIHTATLLHDDVVDNAKTRRGSRRSTPCGATNRACSWVISFIRAPSS